MLSKKLKDKTGDSKLAVIIIIAVAILAIIAIILFMVLSSGNNKKQEEANLPQANTALLDTNTEITLEEKNNIKENYLDKFSLLISNRYQTGNEGLVQAAKLLIEMKEAQNNITSNQSTNSVVSYSPNNSTTIPAQTNTTNVMATNSVGGTTADNTQATNSTLVVEPDSVIQGQNLQTSQTVTNSANIVTASNTTNSAAVVADQNTSAVTPNATNTIAPSTDNTVATAATTMPSEDEITKAISEISNETVEDLSTIMSQVSRNSVEAGYVTDIVSISKENGVYDIIYKVCWPTKNDYSEYVTMERVNTAKIDTLPYTLVNIKLTRNMSAYDYSEYKINSIEEIETQTPTCYYLSFTNNKYGVIDETGKTVISNTYDWIDIPNNYKDIFVCLSGNTTTVLNSAGEQIYKDFENISVIRSSAGPNSLWYERDFLLYQSAGKYGAIDYDGFEIFEPIYDSIEPLYYLEGKIILTESGRQALADVTGKIISNFKYTKIGLLGGQFALESMVTPTRTIEQVQEMVQTAYYIVGQDTTGVVEAIRVVTPDEFVQDSANLQKINYPQTIANWQYTLVDGLYNIYVQ